jgi:zinc protease
MSTAMRLANILSVVTLAACASARSTPAPVVEPRASREPVQQLARPAPREPVRVVELRNEASPRVTFRIVLQGGSADDPTGKEGLTRLVARLMVEGGTQALTFEQLTRRLFPMAAEIHYQIDRDQTVITGEAHRDHVTVFYPLLRDVLLAPRFADEDFRRVKTQSLADLRLDLRGSSDETLGKELLQSIVYPGHPYGHPPVGTERGLEGITLDDVRAHYRSLFCTARITVGLAGGYPAALVDTVRNDLDALPAQCADRAPAPAVERPRGMHVVIVDKPASSSTAISLGAPLAITRRDDDFAAVQFATSHLGLHRQSVGVLYQTIREARGLNYGDYAYAEHFEQENGTRFPRPNVLRRQQYASVWIRPVPSRAAHFALRAAVRALDRTVREGVSQDDLTRVRGFLDGYVGLYTQTEAARLGYAIDDALTGNAQGSWATRTRAAWAALTPDAVRAATQRNLTAQDLWVAIIAPNAQELAQAIGSNAPSPITYDTPKPAAVMAEDEQIAVYPLPVRPDDVRVVPLAEVFR